jgi:hypothetical protein
VHHHNRAEQKPFSAFIASALIGNVASPLSEVVVARMRKAQLLEKDDSREDRNGQHQHHPLKIVALEPTRKM